MEDSSMINRAEYWLLDAVIGGFRPLGELVHPRGNETYNRALGHLLDYPQLLDTLDRMFQRGDLIAGAEHPDTEEWMRFVPTREDLNIALAHEIFHFQYEVTPQGGALWEMYSAPQWDRHLGGPWLSAEELHHYDELAQREYGVMIRTVASINRDLVEEYVSLEMQQGTIIGAPEWRTLMPYEATHWKTFPRGYQVILLYKEKTSWVTDEEVALSDQLGAFWRQSWYTNPFGYMFRPPGLEQVALDVLKHWERRRLRRTRPDPLPPIPPSFPHITNGISAAEQHKRILEG
jgi:hypothetical protein